MIMEFVGNSKDIGNIEEKYLLNEDILKDIGRIVMFDLILNNWDRMPTGYDGIFEFFDSNKIDIVFYGIMKVILIIY